MTPFEQKLRRAMDESERKAWDALARYKFWMFGYHAGAWVRDNRFGGFKLPNPWLGLVRAARDHMKAQAVSQPAVEVEPAPPRETLAQRLRRKREARLAAEQATE